MTFEPPMSPAQGRAAQSAAAAPSAAAAMTAPRRVRVIFNPTAGGAKGRRLHATLDALRAMGCTLDLRETTQRGDAERFGAEANALTDPIDIVVAAGGDGTINEVINGILSRPPNERLPLGIIPLGTANVLALEMGLSLDPTHIARALAEGGSKTIHLAEILERDSGASLRNILLMGGAGFDAQVVAHVDLGLKKRMGKMAYVIETFKQGFSYRFPPIQGEVDGVPFEAATVVICNGRLYGGPYQAVPQASLTDPDLYLVLLRRKGLWNALRYAAALGRGRLGALKDVDIIRFSELSLQTPPQAPLQVDGDIVTDLPVRITQSRKTVELIWP